MTISISNSRTKLALAAMIVVLLAIGLGGSAWGATPHPMSAGPYHENFSDIPNWTNAFAAGSGADRWASVPVNATGIVPDGVKTTASTATFQTAGTGGVQRGSSSVNPPGTIVLLATGTTDNTSALAIDLLLDFSTVNAGYLSFDWASVNNGTGNRKASLRVYWSTDGITFAEIPAAAVLNATNNAPTSGNVSVQLPSGLDDSNTARLRFYLSNGSGGTTGSRPKIAIDNLYVTTSGNRAIAARSNGGGMVSPSGMVAVADDADQTFAFTPAAGYQVRNVRVDGVSQGALASYTFTNVAASHSLYVSFAGPEAGWWPMNQAGGTSVPDSSSHGSHATAINGGTWAAGVDGNALSLASVFSQYAVTGTDRPSLNATDEVTMAAWIRPNSAGTMPVIAKETFATPVRGYALELSSIPPFRPFFRLDNNIPGSGRLEAVKSYPRDGSWMHVAATYDGATMKVYVNGVLDASLARSGALPVNTLALAMGAQSTGEPGRFYNGSLDDVRVYGYALDASEIAALATHPLNVTIAGSGTVGKSPDQATYAHATTVNLTATPQADWQFVGWSGDTSATTNPLPVAMNRTRNITATFSFGMVSVETGPISALELSPVAPNPIRGEATFRFALPQAGHVRLEILDVQGRRLAILADEERGAGPHEATWNGRSEGGTVANGVYFLRFQGLGRDIKKRFVALTR